MIADIMLFALLCIQEPVGVTFLVDNLLEVVVFLAAVLRHHLEDLLI